MPIQIRDLDPDISINGFIQSDIQAKYSFVTSADDVIDIIEDILYDSRRPRFRYNVAEVIKHGSLGQGTSLKNMSDIDLVVYLNDLTVESMPDHMELILNDMDRVFRRHLRKYKRLSQDKFRLGFQLQVNGQIFRVDLLPGIPVSGSLHHMYEQLSESESSVRDYYSVTFAKQQQEFIRSMPTKLKSLIQLMKYWCKVDLKDFDDVKFPSYVMGLIVIHTWEKYGSPSYFITEIGFKAVLKTLSRYHKMHKVWLDEYYDSDIWSLFKEPSGAYLIDPANPNSNLLDSVTDWDTVVDAARSTLQSPLMRKVSVTADWE